MLQYHAFQADQRPGARRRERLRFSFVLKTELAPCCRFASGPVLPKGMAMVRSGSLSAQTEGFDDRTIPIDVLAFHIVEQPAPLAHEHQQTPP